MRYLIIALALSACVTSKPDTYSVPEDTQVDIICADIGLLLHSADVVSYTFHQNRLIIVLDDGTVINENANSCTIITKEKESK